VQLAIRKRSFKPHIILPKLIKRSKDIFISKNYAAKAAEFNYRPKPTEVFIKLCKEWNLLTAKERVKY
jgi:2-keto-4-pentenoate hydratase/2-oxohepta-3-ene-1,7-dioic acid hydratase in catechol pathway